MCSEKKKEDVVLIVGKDEDSQALRVFRKRNDRIEPGLVKPAEPGKPLLGDLVRLKPRPECPILCDVETIYEFQSQPPSDEAVGARRSRGGPAWVVTDAYREGWERIFGPGRPKAEVN